MIRFLLGLLIASPLYAAGLGECFPSSECEVSEGVALNIGKALGWDEVLDDFSEFQYKPVRLKHGFFKESYAVGFSNGSISALLLIVKENNTYKLKSSIDIANYALIKLCDLNNDKFDDVCFRAFPKGTSVEPYNAKYIQTGSGFSPSVSK